jgi:hypothetical protein
MARRILTAACLAAAALLSSGCGSQGVSVAKDDPHYGAAVLFVDRCGACHTLGVAGTHGSATSVKDKENVDGPNFDTRGENVEDVVYAIENGGFSGAIRPEYFVTGSQKQQLAEFLAKYAGSKVKRPPGGAKPAGTK